MQTIVTEFLNTPRLDPGPVQDFMSRHGIAFTKHGVDTGKDWLINTDKQPGIPFALEPIQADDHVSQAMAKDGHVIPVDSERYVGLASALSITQDEVRRFVDAVIESGKIDLGVVNEQAARLGGVAISFEPCEDGSHAVKLVPGKLETFEAHLWFKGIIEPLMKGDLDAILKIRRCPNCGLFLRVKDPRRMYCSDKCKMAAHYIKTTQR